MRMGPAPPRDVTSPHDAPGGGWAAPFGPLGQGASAGVLRGKRVRSPSPSAGSRKGRGLRSDAPGPRAAGLAGPLAATETVPHMAVVAREASTYRKCDLRTASLTPVPTHTGMAGAGTGDPGLPAGAHDPSGGVARNPPAPRGGLNRGGRGLGAGGGGLTSAAARGGCEDLLTTTTCGGRARIPPPTGTGEAGSGPVYRPARKTRRACRRGTPPRRGGASTAGGADWVRGAEGVPRQSPEAAAKTSSPSVHRLKVRLGRT